MYESNYNFNLAEISLYYSLKICQHNEINNIVGEISLQLGTRDSGFGIRLRYSVFTAFPDFVFRKMFVFRKIWRALFSWNTRFEIRPFTLLPTISKISRTCNTVLAPKQILVQKILAQPIIVGTDFSMIHALNFPKICEKGPKRLKTLKFEHSSFLKSDYSPLQRWPQNKIKMIGSATACDTLIISCNFDLSHPKPDHFS